MNALSRRPQRHNRSSSANVVKEIQILYTSVYRPQQMINVKCKAGLLSGDELIASGLDHSEVPDVSGGDYSGERGRREGFRQLRIFLYQHHLNKKVCVNNPKTNSNLYMDFEQELKGNKITLKPFVMVIGGALRIPGKKLNEQ